MVKKIEEKYQELSEVQHILQRPGMWVGSIKSEEKDAFIYNHKIGKFEMKIRLLDKNRKELCTFDATKKQWEKRKEEIYI